MWLLNTYTWEMKEFISHKQAPPYVILSHTWGDEEVSFREWQYEPLKDVGEKEGFRKIDNFCRHAAADGFQWVWVDTCCIDKSSSAELSEAINSMFQWYKSAAVCYAYLGDVRDDIASNLAGSRWVTRGWTLQELIAPREVVFYSSDWQVVGTRSALSAQLAAITRIDESFLAGRSLDEASIAQRMCWAAKRTTSRVEDVAYCLLGIFGVNMPLIYGEGPNAFRRLQEVLVREYPADHSLFAWGKAVQRLPNQVENSHMWALTNIKHDPDKAGRRLCGLLAESPADFRHSGRVVRAPDARDYISLGTKTPFTTTSVGRTVRVKLPILDGAVSAFHLRRPPIVQLLYIHYIVLLCGQWNDSHRLFHYIIIPIVWELGDASRIEEMIVSQVHTHRGYSSLSLIQQLRKLAISPPLSRSPPNGSLVIRKTYSTCRQYSLRGVGSGLSIKAGLIEIPSPTRGLIYCIGFEIDSGLVVAIIAARPENLVHPHENQADGKECGRLRFGLFPFTVPDVERASLSVSCHSNDLVAPAVKTQLTPKSFPRGQDADRYIHNHWEDTEYTHDMNVPRDEWRISVIGYMDIYITIERMFFDGPGSDVDSDEDDSHPFMDVLDFVVGDNKDGGNVVRERRGGLEASKL